MNTPAAADHDHQGVTPLRETWVEVCGGPLRVRRRGRGRPVLMLHGAFVNGHLWDGVIEALPTDTEVEVIVPDLPLGGHHRSLDRAADLSIPALATMVLAVADTAVADAETMEPITLVANDTGGALAQHLLATRPDRFSAALLTSTDAFDNFPPSYFRPLLVLLRWSLPMWAVGKLLRWHAVRRLPIALGHLIHHRLPAAQAEELMGSLWRSRGARHDLRRFMIAVDPGITGAAAKRFHLFGGPVDIAWSADDHVFPPEHANRLAEAFPQGRRVADILDSGSLSPLDQPAQVAARLADLLSRTDGPGIPSHRTYRRADAAWR